MPEIGQTVSHYKSVEKPTSFWSKIAPVIGLVLSAVAADERS
jgi:hypothetical protein